MNKGLVPMFCKIRKIEYDHIDGPYLEERVRVTVRRKLIKEDVTTTDGVVATIKVPGGVDYTSRGLFVD